MCPSLPPAFVWARGWDPQDGLSGGAGQRAGEPTADVQPFPKWRLFTPFFGRETRGSRGRDSFSAGLSRCLWPLRLPSPCAQLLLPCLYPAHLLTGAASRTLCWCGRDLAGQRRWPHSSRLRPRCSPRSQALGIQAFLSPRPCANRTKAPRLLLKACSRAGDRRLPIADAAP